MLLALFCGFFVNLIKKSLTTRFWAGHKEQHIAAALAFGEVAVHGEVVQEALSGVDAVAVLILVGGIVGVGHQEHVVVGIFGTHGIIADDSLPVAAKVVPADHDGFAFGQPALNVIHPDAVGIVLCGHDIKTAHPIENVDGLIQRCAGIAFQLRAVQRVAQSGQTFLVPIAQLAVPVQNHQRCGDAAGPFAGLLHGLEVVEYGQRVRGFHVVHVGMGEIGGVLVVAGAFHGVRTVLRGEVNGVGNLHFVAEIFSGCGRGLRFFCGGVLGSISRFVSVGAAGQQSEYQSKGERQSDCFFHF